MNDEPKPETRIEPAERPKYYLSGADRAVLIRAYRARDRAIRESQRAANEALDLWQRKVDEIVEKMDLPFILGDLDLDTGELLPRDQVKPPTPAGIPPAMRGPPGSKLVART